MMQTFTTRRACLWLCLMLCAFASSTVLGAEANSTVVSLERKLQAVYKSVSPAIVKVMVDRNDDRVLAEGAIVSPSGHILMRNTPELMQHFRDQRPLLFVLTDGRQLAGTPLGWSNEWRIALAKITDDASYTHVSIAEETDLSAGQMCAAFEFARVGAPSAGGSGNQRESNPNIQLGCITNVASGKWFRASCRVDHFPAVFDLEGRLIGVTAVKPIFEDAYYTAADVIHDNWKDLAAGKNLDRQRLSPKPDADDNQTRNQPESADKEANGEAIPEAIENAAEATVRIRPAAQQERGWSGVIISPDGLVATCAHHKLLPGEPLVVLLPDGRSLPAKVLGMNAVSDVGLVKITDEVSLPHVDLGDSTEMHGSDSCWLVGFPSGHEGPGPVVRAMRIEDRPELPWSSTLHTSKTVESKGGDSGGGVFNAAGQLVAIHQGKNPDDFGRQQRVELLRAEWGFLRAGAKVQQLDDQPLREIAQAFEENLAHKDSVVVDVLRDGQPTILGTIVADDGTILTKWSELYGAITVRLSDGKTLPGTMTKFSRANDLALLKINAAGLRSVDWTRDGTPLPGTLVGVSLPQAASHFGAVSHGLRAIPTLHGCCLAGVHDSADGLKVIDNGWLQNFNVPLHAGDILVSVEGHATPNADSLLALLGDSDHPGNIVAHAGDPISILIRRKQSTLSLTFPLPAPTWPRPDGESRRCSGFPAVFDTDLRLTPEICGAPLFGLKGNAIGIAIACRRTGQTHVIPAATAIQFIAN